MTNLNPAPPEKLCTRCRVERPVSEFSRRNERSSGYDSQCKPCRREIDRERYRGNRNRKPTKRKRVERAEAWPGAATLRFEDDIAAQAIVACMGPQSPKRIGLFLGITHQRVQQIELLAMHKLKRGLVKLGWSEREVVEWLDHVEARHAKR